MNLFISDQNIIAKHIRANHHAWNVERTLEEIALGWLCH